jgi:hypothetical protein
MSNDEILGVRLIHGRWPSPYIHGLILTDYMRWGPIQDELDKWCDQFDDVQRNGMILNWVDPSFFILFKLKWSQ